MRDILKALNLLEARQEPSEAFVSAIEPTLDAISGGHIHLTAIDPHVVEVHSLDAETPGQGYGTKVMVKLCKLADTYRITLTLEVESNDEHSEDDEDSEGTWEDDASEPARKPYMDATDLVGWYGRYGFEPVSSHWTRIRLTRMGTRAALRRTRIGRRPTSARASDGVLQGEVEARRRMAA
ncbi:MAG: hypothetical protein EON55_23390 [Alphaproteobacteria bacterium]|nr:MAG: hypothetical protein EON55_23390 [Alphaproteobacteria bacterium]